MTATVREKKLPLFLVSFFLLVLIFLIAGRFDGSPWLIAFVFLVAIPFMTGLQVVMWWLAEASVPKPQRAEPIVKSELEKQLLALNDARHPFEIKAKDNYLVFSWKLADAFWYEWFQKAHISASYELWVKLDEVRHTSWVMEKTKTTRRAIGPLSLLISGASFRGWTPALFQKEKAWGVKQILPPQAGKVYDIRLNSRLFRENILATIAKAGWKIYPCTLSLKLGI